MEAGRDGCVLLADHYEGENQYGCTGESLQRYLDAYAMAMRRQQGRA